MVMPPCGTFHYIARVEGLTLTGRLLRAADQTHVEAVSERDDLSGRRLVGGAPTLEIGKARLVLKAAGRRRATVSSASFSIDPGVPQILEADDVVHLVRTDTGDLALSVLRRDELVVAIGAVTVVPLGLAVKAEGTPFGPSIEWPRHGTYVDVTFGQSTVRVHPGDTATLGPYGIHAVRCFEDGEPGCYESLAISKQGAMSAAIESAKLFARPHAGLHLTRWSTASPAGILHRLRKRVFGS
jgi:hypothetical protein